METDQSGISAMSLEGKLLSVDVDGPFVGSREASFTLRVVQTAASI